MSEGTLEFDFDSPEGALQARWRENEERERRFWTEETRCISWLNSWRHPVEEDFSWWKALPSYERSAWLSHFDDACRMARATGQPVREPGYFAARAQEALAKSEKLAESWAEEIRKAFIHRKPCPIIPAPGYENILAWAFVKAAVPAECLPPQQLEEEAA
ncbi:hypothetical protein BH09VER1_BH09VER1_24950 [soil metagenome]